MGKEQQNNIQKADSMNSWYISGTPVQANQSLSIFQQRKWCQQLVWNTRKPNITDNEFILD